MLGCRRSNPIYKNGYVLVCLETRKGLYIDPGEEVPQVLEWLRRVNVELALAVATHGHLDHIRGVSDLSEAGNVPMCLHPGAAEIYERLPLPGRWFGSEYSAPPPVARWLSAGRSLR